MSTANNALDWAKTKLGCAYDQNRRFNTNPDIFDCSSFVYRAFKAAGYTMKWSTSTNEVNDPGFSLIWPTERANIGKTFGKLAQIKPAGWVPTPADLIFYNQKSTSRANKITHVAFVLDSGHILHARNPQTGVLINDISLYDGTICAVTRFGEAPVTPVAPVAPRNLKLTKPPAYAGYMRGDDVTQVQKRLIALGENAGKVDGIFGPRTENAVINFQIKSKLVPDGIVGPKTRVALKI